MATVGDVRVRFLGDAASLQGALNRVGAGMKKFATIVKNVAKIAVVAFVGIGAAALKAATTIEAANRTIIVGTGATGKALRRLKADFREVFRGVPESAGTVAGSIANLSTLFGTSGKPLRVLTKQLLDLSRLTGGDASQNSLQFGRAMKQFGINAQDSALLLDTFFKITQDTGIAFERLTRDLREFGPVLKLANISAAEGARIIGDLSAEGINFTRVSPALRQGFINFAKEGKNVREELAKVIEQVKNTGSEQEAVTILTKNFGTEVGRLAVVMRSGAFALNDNSAALEKNRGLIAKIEEETRTFGDEFAILRNKVVLALKPVGDAFLTMFRAVLPKLEAFIEQVGMRLPTLVLGAFEAMAKGISAIGPGFITILNGISIATKALALGAIGVAIAFKALQQVKAFKEFDLKRVREIQVSIDGLKESFGAIKDSIKLDVTDITNAQKTADGLAESVRKVKDEFEKTLVPTEGVQKEVEDIAVNVDQVFKNLAALKEPNQLFIGTLEVAGKTIDIQLNSRLEVTKQKLIDIRNLAGQVATAMGGA